MVCAPVDRLDGIERDLTATRQAKGARPVTRIEAHSERGREPAAVEEHRIRTSFPQAVEHVHRMLVVLSAEDHKGHGSAPSAAARSSQTVQGNRDQLASFWSNITFSRAAVSKSNRSTNASPLRRHRPEFQTSRA